MNGFGNHCNGLGSECEYSAAKKDKCLFDDRRTTGRPCPCGKFKMYIFEGIDQDWREFRGYIPGTMTEIQKENIE